MSIGGTIVFFEVIQKLFGVGVSIVVSGMIMSALLGFFYGVGSERKRLAPTPDAKE